MTAIRLEKHAPEKNQYRFYRLDMQPTLFGEWSVVREWGRIGRKGRVVTDTFLTFEQASESLGQKAVEKRRRGYNALDNIDCIESNGNADTQPDPHPIN